MILDNFPKVLWINLDQSKTRCSKMESLLNDNGICHTRIAAVDGVSQSGIEQMKIICHTSNKISYAENACTCSHLKALKYFC